MQIKSTTNGWKKAAPIVFLGVAEVVVIDRPKTDAAAHIQLTMSVSMTADSSRVEMKLKTSLS